MIARRRSLLMQSKSASWLIGCVAPCLLAWACTHPPTGPAAAPPLATEASTPVSVPAGPGRESTAALRAGEVLPAGALPPLRGRGEVRIGDSESPVFHVELAQTAEERTQGLMYRRHLAEDAGMVFDMERTGRWAFWMKNTLIPLDIIFLDAHWRVVCVVPKVPPLTMESRGCDADSRWVLELAGGLAERHQIAAGTPLRFRPLPNAGAPRVTP